MFYGKSFMQIIYSYGPKKSPVAYLTDDWWLGYDKSCLNL